MHLFPNQMALVSTEKFRTDSNQCKEEKECRIPEPAKWRKRHLCSFSSTTVSITSSCKIFESIDYVKRHQHHLFQTHGFLERTQFSCSSRSEEQPVCPSIRHSCHFQLHTRAQHYCTGGVSTTACACWRLEAPVLSESSAEGQ